MMLSKRNIGLYPAAVYMVGGAKWGYINNKGEFAIKPVFDRVWDFQDNGLAVIVSNEFFGVIDTKGKYIVKPEYTGISRYAEGRAIASRDGRYMVIDGKGQVLFENDDYISEYHEGRAVFSSSAENERRYYGYLDRQGNVIVTPQFETAGDFNRGKAVVRLQNGKYALIGENGEIIRTFDYSYVGDISEGLMAFRQTAGDGLGYIDENGNIVIRPQFNSADKFIEKRAVIGISINNHYRYGLIDRSGKYIFKPEYNEIILLGEEMAALGMPIDADNLFKGSKYAVADISGNILTGFVYYDVSEYDNGLASAYDNANTFFINKMGRMVNDLPVIKGIGNLYMAEDLIKADIDFRVSYLKRTGDAVYIPDTSIMLDSTYSIRAMKYRPNRNYIVYYPGINGMSNKFDQRKVNKRLKAMLIPDNINSNEELDYNYYSDFSVDYYKKELVVIQFAGYRYTFGAMHSLPVKKYANINLSSGDIYELKDLFKPGRNYVNVLSSIIRKQIEEAGEDAYFIDNYKGVNKNQTFYITEKALYIYFDIYEIAPYAAGFPTFQIPFGEIMEIIDNNGGFWSSFN